MVAIVLLDANFLFVPFSFRIDIYSEIPRLIEERTEMLLLDFIVNEIEHKRARSIEKQFERQGYAALGLARQKVNEGILRELDLRVPDTGDTTPVDELVLQTALKLLEDGERMVGFPVENVWVATNDKTLKQKCKRAGVGVIHVRKKKVLASF